MRDQITEKIINLIETRSDKGLKTYGVTMERDDLTMDQWFDHAIEEALDLAIYLMKLKTTTNENNIQSRGVHPFVSGAQAGPLASK